MDNKPFHILIRQQYVNPRAWRKNKKKSLPQFHFYRNLTFLKTDNLAQCVKTIMKQSEVVFD